MELSKNAMISFQKPEQFNDFYQSLSIHGGWKIQSGLMNQRGEVIKDTAYVNYLRNLFMSKNLFRRNVSIAEIVSFLDGYEFLSRILKSFKLKVSSDVYDSVQIHIEYKIPYSKNRRVDFVFEYNDQILLTELRLSADFPNQSGMWQKKELELIIYKELMTNFLTNKSIYLYAFIGMPEYIKLQKISKNILYNDNNIEFFVDYLITYLVKDIRRPSEFDITRKD
jgi:hypothetical protein